MGFPVARHIAASHQAATSGASALDATLPFDELALVTENVVQPREKNT